VHRHFPWFSTAHIQVRSIRHIVLINPAKPISGTIKTEWFLVSSRITHRRSACHSFPERTDRRQPTRSPVTPERDEAAWGGCRILF